MVLVEAIALNEPFVLLFGTFTLLSATFLLILFAFLFQRKLLLKQKAFRDIEVLLQKQETRAAYAVLEAQELERKRIAEDLHDRLGSRLAAVKLHFQAFEHNAGNKVIFFSKGSELLNGALDEVREISHNLVSGVLSKFGLTAALHDLKETLESTKQIQLQLQVHHIDQRLELNLEVGIYRIVQELVSNILKHSRATEVTIQLSRLDAEILLLVEDNGVGFDCNKEHIQSPGIGLFNIGSRLNKLNGRLQIDSSPNNGTVVTIEIPIQNDQYSIS